MMFSQKKFRAQPFVSATLAIAASVTVIAGFVYGATTIGTNVSIDGNLTVSGTTATSTFSTGGFTVGANQFVIQQNSGSVGIGTTSPVAILDVQVNNPTGIPELARFQNTNVGNDGSYIFFPRPSDTTRGLRIGHQIGVGTSTYIGIRGGVSQHLYTSAGLDNAGVRGFIVLQDSGGNVGIGTTSPGTLLGVQGDIVGAGKLTVSNFAATSTTATSTFSTGGLTIGTNQFVVQQTSGNVGIGTVSPSALLSLGAGVTAQKLLLFESGAARYGVGIQSGEFRDFIADSATNGFTFGTVSAVDGSTWSEKIRITTGGSIGIGTTSPAQLLSVAGDAYIAGSGTTTLNLKTTTASKGTCIEMFDSGGAVRRLYINAAGAITVEAGTCK